MTKDKKIKQDIIKQKLKENPDSILYIKTNIPYKNFYVDNQQIAPNYDYLLKIFNKNILIANGLNKIDVGSYFVYKTKINTPGIGFVKFKYNPLSLLDINKIVIGDCKDIKQYNYYVNLTKDVCLMSNTKIENVKIKYITQILENKKVYPNILGIPNQIGILNLSIPIMFALIIFMLSLGLIFFKKKFKLI